MIIDFHTHIFSSDICLDRTPGLADGQFRCIYAAEKSKLISLHDLMEAMKKEMQNLTDEHTKKVDELFEKKSAELMQF